ncbi:MAG: hypothetical protein JKX82_06480 [Oleispira sp.]|nr:hypothetical protein [Oleispira sp.]
MKKFDNQTKKVGGKDGKGGAMGGILATARKIAPAIGAAFAIREIALFGKEAIMLGANLEGIKNAFQLIGDEGKTSMSVLKEATRGAVDEMTLMSLAVQAKNFKIPLENLGRFFEFATIRAAQTGEAVEHLTRSIVLGIGRKSPLILDNLGITLVRLKEAMGKVGRESATVADISAAVAKVAEEEIDALERLGLASVTTAQRLSKLTASYKNFKAELGEDITQSGGFKGVSGFISSVQDRKELDRIIEDLKKRSGLGAKELGKEFSKVFLAGGFSKIESRAAQIAFAKHLEELVKMQFEASKEMAVGFFGDPKQAKSLKEWFDSATKGYEELSKSGFDESKKLARAINLLYKEETEARSKTLREETKLTEDRNKFLEKYKLKLQEIQVQYDLGMIDPVKKAKLENDVLSDAIVKMTVDVKKFGLVALTEYGEWNSMLETNKNFLSNVTGEIIEQTKSVEELIEAYKKSEGIGLFTEAKGLKDATDFGFPEPDEEVFSELTKKGSEYAKQMTHISRLQRNVIIEEEEANRRRLSALNEYLEALSAASEEIPEWMMELREQLKGSIFDEDKLMEVVRMWSALSSAMSQVAGVFTNESGVGALIGKFAKLASVIAAVVAAQAAFKTLTGDPSAAPRAVAAAAAAFTGIAGIIGSVTGGFGGGSGGGGYNASIRDGGRLYTEISGRNIRVVLEREGNFSNRRG